MGSGVASLVATVAECKVPNSNDGLRRHWVGSRIESLVAIVAECLHLTRKTSALHSADFDKMDALHLADFVVVRILRFCESARHMSTASTIKLSLSTFPGYASAARQSGLAAAESDEKTSSWWLHFKLPSCEWMRRIGPVQLCLFECWQE